MAEHEPLLAERRPSVVAGHDLQVGPADPDGQRPDDAQPDQVADVTDCTIAVGPSNISASANSGGIANTLDHAMYATMSMRALASRLAHFTARLPLAQKNAASKVSVNPSGVTVLSA